MKTSDRRKKVVNTADGSVRSRVLTTRLPSDSLPADDCLLVNDPRGGIFVFVAPSGPPKPTTGALEPMPTFEGRLSSVNGVDPGKDGLLAGEASDGFGGDRLMMDDRRRPLDRVSVDCTLDDARLCTFEMDERAVDVEPGC